MKSKPEVIIVGAGPAGMATALQLKRYGIDAVLFEKDRPGGLLINARLVENVMGFPEGISGPDLVKLFCGQLKRFDINAVNETVMKIDYDEISETFSVSTNGGSHYPVGVVVASGTRANEWDQLNSMLSEIKKYIFHEVVSLLDEKGKKIIIIGAGDAAFDYALNLSAENEVLILNRGTEIKALPLLKDRVKKNPAIDYMDQATIKSIDPGKKRSLAVGVRQNGKNTIREANFIVCALGREPDKRFYTLALNKLEEQLILRGSLHLVGDVCNGSYRQVSIATGNGIQAAMKIYHQWGKGQ
ncbi:MAG: NAD(P)/FAD-dependent oxidoreductase [Candidatus Aminicenantes bacterium]|nr:NAD(P)/FAD-dependent oxidoreductase [Candidatus Aminicenantes bacterium]